MKVTAFLALVLLAPVAAAQVDFEELPQRLAVDGTAQVVAGTVTLDCADVLAAGGTLTQAATIEGPSWLAASATDATAGAMDCLGQLSVTTAVEATLSAKPGAPGMQEESVTITYGSEGDEILAAVNYKPSLSVTTDESWPLAVNGPTKFNVTFSVESNAATMIMWDPLQGVGDASISGNGPAFNLEAPSGAPILKVVELTFTPPPGQWSEVTVNSTAWSHWPQDDSYRTEVVASQWVFTNAAPPPADKESPAPAFPALAILALAFLARRR